MILAVILIFTGGCIAGGIAVALLFRNSRRVRTFIAKHLNEKQAAAAENSRILEKAMEADCDLLVLDELCAALAYGLADRQTAMKAVLQRPEGREVVVTGRDPEKWLTDAADYITEMRSVRHPYDKGTSAREGIEY